MTKLILRRLGLGVLTLFLVSIVVFLATQVLPGNAATAILGQQGTPARIAALEHQLHLDQSLWSQYRHWISGVVRGDFGTSLAAQQPVTDLLRLRVENSAFLVLVAGLITVPLALVLGMWAAVRRDRLVDHAISTTTLVFVALPAFVVGIVLALLLATSLFHVFPAVSLLPPGEPAWRHPDVAVLPIVALVLTCLPHISRMMRASMIEVLESDYVQMARLKGLSERVVIVRHAVPNALVPAVQSIALTLIWMAGGVVIIEYVFRYPGIGSSMIDAVNTRDVTVVQALALLLGALYVVLNLVADVISILLTPKLRTALR
jgi:peptide/nickel transport system permease protein